MSVPPVATPLASSSGDPALDRRLDWARGFLEAGEAQAAADLLAETVGEAPGFLAAWFLLGEAREAGGDQPGAIAAYEQARALDAADALGAGLRLARLGAAAPQGAMSDAYVRTLFDQYAARFDTALRENLAYRGPEVLHAAVLSACAARGRAAAFARALDLGCGTGLAAATFAPLVGALTGVDLSPAMVEQARAGGHYARLDVGEMGAALEEATPAAFDLILAADAFCYVADLTPLFVGASRALAPDGLFAFTLERHEGDGVLLRETLRFAHSADLVQKLAREAGLVVLLCEEVSTRTEKNVPVPGLVAVLAKPA